MKALPACPNRWPAAFLRGAGQRILAAAVCFNVLFPLCPALAQPAPVPASPPAILQDLKSFRQWGAVLYIAAHPDDENTLLLAYLARGRDYRTAYLSLTRGDGGQNVLGPQFDEKLGVARTQELLAARRIDGGRQFFTRAMDFGFSKDYRETLRIWDREQVLADVVRVIRQFRPDVVITRFSTQPGGTHGHHTASAVLGLEAFKVAGDPAAFPEQHLPPWQPRRIFVNGGRGNDGSVHLEISGKDPVLGISFNELAGRSRAMHKTQGFDNFRGSGDDSPRSESFQLLAGAPATNDIMDGIDPTWNRLPGGAPIASLTDQLIASFNPSNVSASVPDLLKLRALLAALPQKDSVVLEKSAQLDRILQSCLGLEIATTLLQSEVVPGESMELRHSATVHSAIPVRWISVQYPDLAKEIPVALDLRSNETREVPAVETLPSAAPLSQPYWLRKEHTPGMFVVDDPALIGQPENPPAFPVRQIFEVGGQRLVLPDAPVQLVANAASGALRRPLDVIPPVSLAFSSPVALFGPGKSHSVEVQIVAARNQAVGALRLKTPDGWLVSPSEQAFSLKSAGDRQTFAFTLTAPARPATAKIIADAAIAGAHYQSGREEIAYPHIPRQLLLPPASLKVLSLDLATRGHTIGYLPGAGDTVADALQAMGYAVTILNDSDLTPEKLHAYDAIVIGVRAFNVRTNLPPHLDALFNYISVGGTVVAQYNRPDRLAGARLAPYDLHLSGLRVTDETAPVTFLAPDHPVLNTPNQITAADFEGWVQERGIYFPDQWDEHFTPILACNDPGESPLKGSLLVASYGKGCFVYTGLVFFRELPAGVPGAYRLLANLVSLGK